MNLTRKILALALTLLAALVAAWPAPSGAELVVAAHDLPAGVPLAPDDLRTIHVPPELSPTGALSRDEATGRALAAAARPGEPLTDARLLPADPDTASVAVRLADPAVARLLRTGSRVDVVGAELRVLADNASVVAVQADEVAVLAVSREAATRVASESLTQPVALTLR
ncbi:Flp pilus assembly protein CpaB [Saccharothrix tamanrassetensis]|uniref:Flp pilus assembly protein CpaB n=1 Tax=Saccharothrix tamanrassetensis TaxID=1051531 RepID=A0A841CJM1_9PSEU|nr:SAF domain-containing protein [Saccharothrix tamanrassetensis]MBB5956378.1 Flp pilus assembly protein CpaB [Saccharothrix tamanrassetensis]